MCATFILHSSARASEFKLGMACFDATRIMNDAGLKKQVNRHWKRLREEIAKPLELGQ